jgi:hypothetical protein
VFKVISPRVLECNLQKKEKIMKMKKFGLFVALISLNTFGQGKETLPPVEEFESVVLNFDQGSSNLNSTNLTTLNKAIADAKAKGKITKIEVAAWSDKDHLVTGDLPKADRTLADRRLDTIKQDLKASVGQMKYIHEYNMAENSNWVGRYLHSSEAELDAVFAKRETGTLARPDFALIKSGGSPSKAVIIFKVRNKS